MRRYFIRIFFLFQLTGVFIVVSADDSDQPGIIRAWQLIDFYTGRQDIDIDTMINGFHVHNPVFRQSISSSYLGNAGLAAFSNIFSERARSSEFFFIDHFGIYLNDPSDTRYYNTRRPFSLVDFSSGGPRDKNEKMLNLLHTQNVNPDFNLGFSYFNINSDGQYSSQGAVTNAISLFSSYEQENYRLHASLNLNSVRVFENGGLEDDASLYNENFETEDHAVRLRNARTGLTNRNLFLSHSWQPFISDGNDPLTSNGEPWLRGLGLYHVLQFDQYIRTYNDDNPRSGFYDEILIDNNRTFDSLQYVNLTNMLMLQLPSVRWGIAGFEAKAGLKNEVLRGSYNIPADTVFHYSDDPDPSSYISAWPDDFTITDRTQRTTGSTALIAVARGTAGEMFGISGRGTLFIQGRRQGEYDLQAGINLDILKGKNRSVIEAVIRQREETPSIFLQSFSSNHFSWENDFRRSGESSIRGSVIMPGRRFKAGTAFYLLNNHIYFDSTSNPVRHSEVIPVISVFLDKDFRIWKFHLRNMIRYQVTGNQEVIPLPDLSVYNSTWFEQTLIHDILNMQIGFDIWFTTRYMGYAWQPAISQFYIQNERLLGSYPYVDLFINFKHKRTRVFLKAEHINAGQLEPEYFTVLHHPRNQRMFKFGLSWSFYN